MKTFRKWLNTLFIALVACSLAVLAWVALHPTPVDKGITIVVGPGGYFTWVEDCPDKSKIVTKEQVGNVLKTISKLEKEK